MSEIKQLPTRDEVPTPLTWDLTKIFKDDAAFDVAYNQLTEELNQAESFKGTLGCRSFSSCVRIRFRCL